MIERHDGELDDESPFINKLKQLTQLTPGDFATVDRKLKFSGQKYNAGLVISALADECKFKKLQHQNNKIGFV